MFKLYNKANNLVLTPEKQIYTNADDKTLRAIGALFSSKEEAEATARLVISPKFKAVAVS